MRIGDYRETEASTVFISPPQLFIMIWENEEQNGFSRQGIRDKPQDPALAILSMALLPVVPHHKEVSAILGCLASLI